jgi:Fe-S cluster biogenesis protein NfuA
LGIAMISPDQVDKVLDRIRPLLRSDGGDIELVDVIGNTVRVRLTGRCAGCASAYMTLHVGVERALRREIAEFEQLLSV